MNQTKVDVDIPIDKDFSKIINGTADRIKLGSKRPLYKGTIANVALKRPI